MNPVTVDQWLELMAAKNYTVLTSIGQLNVIGFRNSEARPDFFDDLISIFEMTAEGWQAHHYEASTLPGLPYLRKPLVDQGVAILVPGQYRDAYRIGLHKGKYPALVQVRPVKVYRDNDRDEVYDKRNVEEGLFGINIHRVPGDSDRVGMNSAGCQVIKTLPDYADFLQRCSKAVSLVGNRFSYTLLEL